MNTWRLNYCCTTLIYEHSHDFIIMNFQMHQNRKLLYNSAATFNILYTHVVHNLWYIKHFSLKSRWMTEYYLSFWSYKHHSFNNSRKVAANTTTIFCSYQVMVCFDLFSNYINNILHLQVQVILVPIHTKRQTHCNVTIMFSRQNTPACSYMVLYKVTTGHMIKNTSDWYEQNTFEYIE